MTPEQADRELNTSYREAMNRLPPATREKLRNAQRAWLAFAEKNNVALRLAAGSLSISAQVCQATELEEVEKRSIDFGYSEESTEPEQVSGRYEQVDAYLNGIYERCLSSLAPDAKAALREAQRAWLVYRTANRPFGINFVTGLTVRRADQLNDFYIPTNRTAPISRSRPVKAERSPPDPFERAR
ncbi:MAG TPA: lysozyme inhibitor LprI family protein [Chthoniobacterales bacterium]|nr:lysozyme inhibitor LprI family protein [Chthoniobacterales bacterium]